jgi:hypothetical protein
MAEGAHHRDLRNHRIPAFARAGLRCIRWHRAASASADRAAPRSDQESVLSTPSEDEKGLRGLSALTDGGNGGERSNIDEVIE